MQLADGLRPEFGPQREQGPPGGILGREPVALGRPQLAPRERPVAPLAPGQLHAAVNAQQLVGRIRDFVAPALPVM